MSASQETERGARQNCTECLPTKPGAACSTQAGRALSVENLSECWPWPGKLTRKGYPANKEHRKACALKHGPAPFEGAEVLHRCDNPSCVRPSHLRWGTHAENVAEQFARGNHRNFRAHGKPYVCGRCGELGHNARTCGTGREGTDTRRRRKPLPAPTLARIADRYARGELSQQEAERLALQAEGVQS